MRLLLLTFAGILAGAIPALAQDPLAGLAAASTPAERAGLLAEIFADDPNSFVFALQDELRERGFRTSAPNGQFTIETIRQLNAFCAEAGIADICARGPLVPAGVAAIAEALYADTPALAAAQAAAPAASPTEPVASNEPDVVFGPVAVEADRASWIWSGMELAGTPTLVSGPVDLRRTGIYDPSGSQWLLGPADYEPAADGSYSLDFTAPVAGGPVRIYPLRGRDDQRWLYTVVEGLTPGADYTASWTVAMDGDAYAVTDLTVAAR